MVNWINLRCMCFLAISSPPRRRCCIKGAWLYADASVSFSCWIGALSASHAFTKRWLKWSRRRQADAEQRLVPSLYFSTVFSSSPCFCSVKNSSEEIAREEKKNRAPVDWTQFVPSKFDNWRGYKKWNNKNLLWV